MLCGGYVRSVSLDPTKGDAYVFAAPARKLMNPNTTLITLIAQSKNWSMVVSAKSIAVSYRLSLSCILGTTKPKRVLMRCPVKLF